MSIKITRLNESIAVDEAGHRYVIANDSRGVNQKVWLKLENGEFKDSYLIKFSTRKPNAISELNLYNEVVCSRLCDKLGLDHVNYEFCEFVDLDGSVKRGVISQNYRESANWVETNGRAVHESYCLLWYDNNYGMIPKLELNTVYTYIKELKTRFESRKMVMSQETEDRLTEEMLTLAIFDYCTCQIDRHWGNVGWLNNNMFDNKKFKIKLVPIYDNECSFLLDDATEESLQKMLENIRTPKKSQVAIDMVNKKRYNSPYLGIKSALVREKEDNKWFLVPRSNDARNLSNAAILAKEIAHEASTRPEIGKLCEKITNFDMAGFLNELDCFNDSNAYLKEIYTFVWNIRVGLLKDEMANYKNNAHGEAKNEESVPSL